MRHGPTHKKEAYLGSCQGTLRNKLYSLAGSIGHSEYCGAIATL